MLLVKPYAFNLVDRCNQLALRELLRSHIVNRTALACPLGKLLDLVF